VDSGVFEVAVGGDGLKDFCVDSPRRFQEIGKCAELKTALARICILTVRFWARKTVLPVKR